MASDAAKAQMKLWRSLGWTEQAMYTPGADGLAPREITVVVDRGQPEAIPHGKSQLLAVRALNDPDAGIPSDPALCDVERDTIAVADRLGGTPRTRSFSRFGRQDLDFVEVELA